MPSPTQAPQIGALMVSPPVPGQASESTQCIVEYECTLYRLTWSTDFPDLSSFPNISDEFSKIDSSPEIQNLLRISSFVEFGANGLIRRLNHPDPEAFPILKLAHSNEESIEMIQHEFDLISELQYYPHAPRISENILVGDRTRGYWMEELFPLSKDDLQSQKSKIHSAIGDLHRTGFCHGDLTPGNIMVNKKGRIVFIDFSNGGRLGTKAPRWHQLATQLTTDIDFGMLHLYNL